MRLSRGLSIASGISVSLLPSFSSCSAMSETTLDFDPVTARLNNTPTNVKATCRTGYEEKTHLLITFDTGVLKFQFIKGGTGLMDYNIFGLPLPDNSIPPLYFKTHASYDDKGRASDIYLQSGEGNRLLHLQYPLILNPVDGKSFWIYPSPYVRILHV